MGNSGEIGKEETVKKLRKNAKRRFKTFENLRRFREFYDGTCGNLEKVRLRRAAEKFIVGSS